MPVERYPENNSRFLRELPDRAHRFAALREEYLLDYCYNTARAYWGDLDDLYVWCESEGLDILGLTQPDFERYLHVLKQHGYSESTVRRRATAWRGFRATLGQNDGV